MQCGEREGVVNNILEGQYGERQMFVALTTADILVEVWGNEETGTWTITSTRPDAPNLICLLAHGEDFMVIPEPPRGEVH